VTAPTKFVTTVLLVALIALAASLALMRGVAGAQTAPDLGLDAGVSSPAAQPAAAAVTPPAPEAVPAAPAVAAPDPVADPGGFVDSVRKLYKGGALVPAILLAAYGLLVLLRSKVLWLRTGKRAVYTAAAVTFLTGCAEAAARGTTPTLGVIVGALFAAITLALQPVPKDGAAAP
jgi:hypothetical protein